MKKRLTSCMYVSYSNDGSVTCQKAFNRGKDCLLHAGKARCGHKRNSVESVQVFQDEKWFWKTGIELTMCAFSSLFYGEQDKFCSKDKPGDNDHAKEIHKRGHYHFIQRDIQTVLSIVIHLHKYLRDTRKIGKQFKFLDCGCGVGNVVMMAHLKGFDAYGIEYDTVTLRRGRKLLKQFKIDPKRLSQGDILEYPNYADYDVLYGYCPMCNHEKEKEFEAKLKHDMRIGAILAGISANNCEKIGKDYVFFKKLELGYGPYNTIRVNQKIAHEKG